MKRSLLTKKELRLLVKHYWKLRLYRHPKQEFCYLYLVSGVYDADAFVKYGIYRNSEVLKRSNNYVSVLHVQKVPTTRISLMENIVGIYSLIYWRLDRCDAGGYFDGYNESYSTHNLSQKEILGLSKEFINYIARIELWLDHNSLNEGWRILYAEQERRTVKEALLRERAMKKAEKFGAVIEAKSLKANEKLESLNRSIAELKEIAKQAKRK